MIYCLSLFWKKYNHSSQIETDHSGGQRAQVTRQNELEEWSVGEPGLDRKDTVEQVVTEILGVRLRVRQKLSVRNKQKSHLRPPAQHHQVCDVEQLCQSVNVPCVEKCRFVRMILDIHYSIILPQKIVTVLLKIIFQRSFYTTDISKCRDDPL